MLAYSKLRTVKFELQKYISIPESHVSKMSAILSCVKLNPMYNAIIPVFCEQPVVHILSAIIIRVTLHYVYIALICGLVPLVDDHDEHAAHAAHS